MTGPADHDAAGTRAMPAIDSPSTPPAVTEHLTEQLRRSICYLEYGAGASSVMAARLAVPDVLSVDSDQAFLEHVSQEVERVGGETRFHPIHVDIGPTGNWGRPTDRRAFASWPAYAQAGFETASRLGLEPDFILIDGRFRVACFLAALLSANAGTPVLMDDYAGRSKYSFVERFAPLEGMVDRAATFVIPQQVDTRAVAFALARYSVMPAS